MKRHIFTTCVVFALATSAAGVMAAENPQQQIQALYNRISQALADKDVDAIMATRAEGYQSYKSNGKLNKDDKEAERKYFDGVFARATTIRDNVVVLSFTPDGKDVIVLSKESYTRTQQDRARGLVLSVHVVSTSRDFWVKGDGSWLLKRSRDINAKVTKTLNGKVMP